MNKCQGSLQKAGNEGVVDGLSSYCSYIYTFAALYYGANNLAFESY